jgi:hypothetical protein
VQCYQRNRSDDQSVNDIAQFFNHFSIAALHGKDFLIPILHFPAGSGSSMVAQPYLLWESKSLYVMHKRRPVQKETKKKEY